MTMVMVIGSQNQSNIYQCKKDLQKRKLKGVLYLNRVSTKKLGGIVSVWNCPITKFINKNILKTCQKHNNE